VKSHLSIWSITEGRAETILTVDHRIEAPNWHPSGGYLLVNGDGRLFRVPLADPRLEPFETGVEGRCNNDHGYSPDGRMLAFCCHRGQGAEMFVMPADGGPARRVISEPRSWFHGWSPDGTRLVYAAARGDSRQVGIFTVPVKGGPEVRVTDIRGHSDGPDFGHDGRQIYWNCDHDGHAQIWIMAADGADARALFRDDHVNWFPHPSPCGRHLIYLAYPPGTEGHPPDLPVAIVLCRPDGSDRRRIVEITGGQGTMNVPNWAPNGSVFAFVHYAP
jgi:Tol biopolymer transport system component